MSVLDTIVAAKKERIAQAKKSISLAGLRAALRDVPAPLSFREALERRGRPVRLIAEIKKASPSKGLIRQDFDHKAIAALYRGKAEAISVLTEEDFFQGSLSFLSEVKEIAQIPVLRKDFIVDEYQIYEARANQADAILLIAAILDRGQADEYLHLASELGLAVLFEVHDHRELEMVLKTGALIVGINNRNLKTLKIDLDTTFALKRELPQGKIVVSESGIRTRRDVLRLEEAGVDAMLVGTSFMESDDITRKIDELRAAS